MKTIAEIQLETNKANDRAQDSIKFAFGEFTKNCIKSKMKTKKQIALKAHEIVAKILNGFFISTTTFFI